MDESRDNQDGRRFGRMASEVYYICGRVGGRCQKMSKSESLQGVMHEYMSALDAHNARAVSKENAKCRINVGYMRPSTACCHIGNFDNAVRAAFLE